MAKAFVIIAITITILTSFVCHRTLAQSSCTDALASMTPCLDYITGNSSTPSSSCCSQLANVVSSQPQCLCQGLNGGGSSLGINVNQTRAAALPAACKVRTPPVSRCGNDSASGKNESPSGNGSKTTEVSGWSDGNSTNLTFSLLFLLPFLASIFTSV